MIRKLVIGGILIIAVIFFFQPYKKAESEIELQESPAPLYVAVCLARGKDTDGSDIKLRPYYHIAHTPKEGGRCYFRFSPESLICLSPRQAQLYMAQTGDSLGISYPGPQGTACYFPNPEKYTHLITQLKKRPPVSYKTYNAVMVNSWTQVRDMLLQAIPPINQE